MVNQRLSTGTPASPQPGFRRSRRIRRSRTRERPRSHARELPGLPEQGPLGRPPNCRRPFAGRGVGAKSAMAQVNALRSTIAARTYVAAAADGGADEPADTLGDFRDSRRDLPARAPRLALRAHGAERAGRHSAGPAVRARLRSLHGLRRVPVARTKEARDTGASARILRSRLVGSGRNSAASNGRSAGSNATFRCRQGDGRPIGSRIDDGVVQGESLRSVGPQRS